MITMQLIAQSKTKTRSKPCQLLPTLVETGAAQRREEGRPKGAKTIECCKGHSAASLGAELGLRLWLGLLLRLRLGLLLQIREMKPGRILLLHNMVRIIPSLDRDPHHIYWIMMRQRMGSRIMNVLMKMEKQRFKKIKW